MDHLTDHLLRLYWRADAARQILIVGDKIKPLRLSTAMLNDVIEVYGDIVARPALDDILIDLDHRYINSATS